MGGGGHLQIKMYFLRLKIQEKMQIQGKHKGISL